jgi:signal transduction histidine kinase
LFKTAAHEQIRAAEAALEQALALAQERGMLLDRVGDAILVVDRDGTIRSGHGGGTAFFSRGGRVLAGAAFESLFAPDARVAAAVQLARVVREGGTVSAELTALAGDGELRTMMVAIAQIDPCFEPLGIEPAERLSVVLRDIAVLKRADAAAPVPEKAAALAESIAARPSLVRVSLNEVVNACVTEQQGAASAARVVIRTALSPGLQPVLADAEAMRSMIVNLLLHALRTTRPGGQVIVSTGRSAGGEAVLRIRDSGEGLNEKAIEAALQASPPSSSDPQEAGGEAGGQTSGLALAKALAEANHARFAITSKPQQGSLFEVTFTAEPESVAPVPDRRAAGDAAGMKPVDGKR